MIYMKLKVEKSMYMYIFAADKNAGKWCVNRKNDE